MKVEEAAAESAADMGQSRAMPDESHGKREVDLGGGKNALQAPVTSGAVVNAMGLTEAQEGGQTSDNAGAGITFVESGGSCGCWPERWWRRSDLVPGAARGNGYSGGNGRTDV